MDWIRSKLYPRQKENSQIHADEIDTSHIRNRQIETDGSHDHKQVSSLPLEDADPKVVEYFKDFPEPYRQKAIERFSSRKGLLYWDVFRDIAMQHEMKSAMKGVFLEDKREHRQELDLKRQKHIESRKEELLEQRRTREPPVWEQKLKTVIPLQGNESMAMKLFHTINFLIIGTGFVYQSWRLKKTQPKIAQWKVYSAWCGSSGIFVFCITAAVYRLYDWGPFDRTHDNRGALTKTVEDFRMFFDSTQKRR